jgi:DNA-binding XRE family transcriptional regulator
VTKRQAKRTTRQLSDEDRAKLRQVREQIEQEKPEIVAKGRALKKAHDAAVSQLREAFMLLRSQREAQGLSLTELRDRTGIGRSALSRLENDPEPNPTITTLIRVADALGKDILIQLVDKSNSN